MSVDKHAKFKKLLDEYNEASRTLRNQKDMNSHIVTYNTILLPKKQALFNFVAELIVDTSDTSDDETIKVSRTDLENFQSTMWYARTFLPEDGNGNGNPKAALERQYEIIKKLLGN